MKTLLKTFGLASLVAISTPDLEAQSKNPSVEEKAKVLNWFKYTDENPEFRDSLAQLIDDEIEVKSNQNFSSKYDPKYKLYIISINSRLMVDLKLISSAYNSSNGYKQPENEGYNVFKREANLSCSELTDIVLFNENKKREEIFHRDSGNLFCEFINKKNMSKKYIWKWKDSKKVPVKDVLTIIGYDIGEIKRKVPRFRTDSFFRKKSVAGFNIGFDFFDDNENSQFELYLQLGLTYGEKKGFFGWGDVYLGSKSDSDKGKINYGAGLGYVLSDSFGLKLGAINQATSANNKGIKFIAGLNYQTSFLLFGVGITQSEETANWLSIRSYLRFD